MSVLPSILEEQFQELKKNVRVKKENSYSHFWWEGKYYYYPGTTGFFVDPTSDLSEEQKMRYLQERKQAYYLTFSMKEKEDCENSFVKQIHDFLHDFVQEDDKSVQISDATRVDREILEENMPLYEKWAEEKMNEERKLSKKFKAMMKAMADEYHCSIAGLSYDDDDERDSYWDYDCDCDTPSFAVCLNDKVAPEEWYGNVRNISINLLFPKGSVYDTWINEHLPSTDE